MVPDAVMPDAFPLDLVVQCLTFSATAAGLCLLLGVVAGLVSLSFGRRIGRQRRPQE